MEKKTFDVTGMTCSACSAHVEKSVSKLPGVSQVQVNLLTNNMKVEFNDEVVNEDNIIKAVEDAGYGASLPTSAINKNKEATTVIEDEAQGMKRRLIVSIIFWIPLMYISMGDMIGLPLPSFLDGMQYAIPFAFTQFLLVLPIIYVNRKYFIVGFKTLWKKAPNMDSLIAIGSTAAIFYGCYAIYKIGYGLVAGDHAVVHHYVMNLYFESAGTILTLITVGKYLEARSKGRTSDAIRKLIDLSPKTAIVKRNGLTEEIAVEDVLVGDILLVKPGEQVPVDGIIKEGSAYLDESALTGESIPVSKTIGDKVMSATINTNGFLEVEALKVGTDTTLSQIINLVEEAGSSKAPIAKLADKVSGIFVPTVIGIALLAFVVWLMLGAGFEEALSIGISVLVISCPCALGLATPVAIMVATGKGAENGILIRSAESLETLHTIDTIVLDKTGTITKGEPVVQEVISLSDYPQDRIVQIAASLEVASSHPLAAAIVTYAEDNHMEILENKNFENLAGKGIRATLKEITYLVGNDKLLESHGLWSSQLREQTEKESALGRTAIYVADESQVLGIIFLADEIKESSIAAVKSMQILGLNVIMLTGDALKTAEAIGAQVHVDQIVAEVLPDQKAKVVEQLQQEGKRVAMVGDGINDAVALVQSDVGLAIGAGSDVAIESADIVLMKSDLNDVVSAIELSHKTIRNIKQNLFWAFFYNTIGIPIAAGVLIPFGIRLDPMFAAAAMSLSSVTVVTNALRLRRFRVNTSEPKKIEKKEETIMKKVIKIEGMSCGHCASRVETLLNEIQGVRAVVNLEDKEAVVEMDENVPDAVLKRAVEVAGYEVAEIK